MRRALARLRGLFALVLMSADEPREDRRRPQRPAARRRHRRGRVLRRVRHPGHPQPHPRRRVPGGRGDGRSSRRTACRSRTSPARPRRPPHAARPLGPHHGGEGRLQALHAQGDLRAAAGGPRHLLGRVSLDTGRVFLEEMTLSEEELAAVENVTILACGTSWHAGLVGKFLIEQLARLPVEVDYGSEYRYRDPIVGPKTLAMVITQSGETADTLAALREARQKGARSMAICNVVGSMATRESDGTVYTHAGPEIGVASTKAFTSQLVALYLLALDLAQVRGTLDAGRAPAAHRGPAAAAPAARADAEAWLGAVDEIARRFYERSATSSTWAAASTTRSRSRAPEAEGDLLHPRRGLPGRRDEARADRAHRRADAGGGDRAARCTCSRRCSATSRKSRRAAARSSRSPRGRRRAGRRPARRHATRFIEPPAGARRCSRRSLAVVPLQLLAYHIAVRRGCDVDQPRNLAKSVTVE